MSRPPLPPFSVESAVQKARMAEDAWNTRDPARVALAYTTDSRWRNRAHIFQDREAIEAFLTRKWQCELESAGTVESSMAIVDALDEAAAGFYTAHGFVRLPDSLRLVLPMRQVGLGPER